MHQKINKIIKIKNKTLDLSKPNVMGILNITPDSFSDGGKFNTKDLALNQITQMIADGADIIDIGAQSTRPGAIEVSVQEELDRLCPVLEELSNLSNSVLYSLDSSKPEVIQHCLNYNIDIINDQRALRETSNSSNNKLTSMEVAAQSKLPVILMHMQGNPETMQVNPHYNNLFKEIFSFFEERIHSCIENGIDKNNIILDPGFGFGKTYRNNAALLQHLDKLHELNCPLAVGMSRKSMIEKGIKNSVPMEERMAPSLALAVMAVERGASIIRVHDVKESRQAIDMAYSIMIETAA